MFLPAQKTTFQWIQKILSVVFLLLLTQISFAQDDPDMPKFGESTLSKEEFMKLRAEAIAKLRGIDETHPFNPAVRMDAVHQMDMQKAQVATRSGRPGNTLLSTSWTPIGPNPIPNGQVLNGVQTPVSGRVTAIAVHPTNPNIVYVGTAQGGLYRSLNGGTTWTALMDNALSLAIGAVAISPSSPDIIYVGTGEPNFSGDSFFGVGVYRIDNATSGTPILSAPLGAAQFNGRAIGEIIVHPTNPAIIFVASTSGVGGVSGSATSPLPNRGVYRSTDATSATPTFSQIGVLASPNNNFSVRDIAIDPSNPNILLANLVAGGGGIYRSINALSATPTWSQVFAFPSGSGGTSNLTAEFAAVHPVGDADATIYAAVGNTVSGNGQGRILKSTDGGATFTQVNPLTFCTPQCFYDIAVDVDPTNKNNVYVGGTGARTFVRSTDGGVNFTASQNDVHTDTHVIAVAPSLPTTIYFGSDGGIYKSINSGTSWGSLNNTTFQATQFMSLAVHPTDPNFTIGGTQDNGTEYQNSAGVWNRADFGDGGFSAIDQNAVNTTNVTMYHTYFNQTNNLIGFGRNTTTPCATEGQWSFKGIYGGAVNPSVYCDGSSDAFNGISISDAVLFYAPIALGPGNPNTVYFGSSKLYRSVNKGDVMTLASQSLINPISAIGISPQNDNVRIVGQNNGGLFGITTGATTLINLDPANTIPNFYIGRAVIDPNNVNTAYVTLSSFGVTNVWKTTNLNNLPANPPTWTAASSGIPQVPVNAFLVDPANSNNLYAGTDIGVYVSTDAGATWVPFGTGLPIVAVFDMAKTAGNLLRIATHGRGMWQLAMLVPCTDNTITLTSAPGTNAQTVCINTPITDITYSTTGATGATFGGLPAGVTGTFATNMVTISGTPSASGTFNYTVTLTGGCGATVTANGSITVTPASDVDQPANQVVCNNTATTAVNFTGSVPGIIFSWTNNNPSIGLAASGIGNISSFIAMNATTSPVIATITVTPSAVIIPVSASTTMGSGFGTSLSNTINGAGLASFPSLTAIHSGTIPNNSWVSLDPTLTGSVTFNLGGTFTVTGLSFWNQNNGGPGALGITGIKDVSLQYSTDGVSFLPIPGGPAIFAQVTGNSAGPEMVNFAGVTGSFIRFVISSNWGDPNQTGFAEVAFKGNSTCAGTPKSFNITVNPTNTISLTSAAGTDNQTVAINTPITNITYSTTGATGANFGGLPAGVTGNWASNVVTISGTPTAAGTFNYTVTLTGGCGAITANGTITVTTESNCPPVTDRIYVDASAAPGGNGSSWSCAINELSAAVVMANGNMSIKSIWVAAGTYKPTTGTDRTAVIATTRADLMILGGFAGGEANASDANPIMNPTIISGDIGIVGDMSDNSYRLFNIGGSPVSSSALVIDGFIFEKGNADAPGDGDHSVGSALLSYGIPAATPVQIKRCIFRNNFGTATGAIFLNNSNPVFSGCRFANNSTNGS
ncbi:MAG: hypothetical protein ABIX01_10905, partial [Chitinophagaceae bacterium]